MTIRLGSIAAEPVAFVSVVVVVIGVVVVLIVVLVVVVAVVAVAVRVLVVAALGMCDMCRHKAEEIGFCELIG